MNYRGYENAAEEIIFETDRTRVTRLTLDNSPSLIVKEFATDYPDNELIAAFRYENEILQGLDSDFVVKSLAFTDEGGHYALVMEDGGISLEEQNHIPCSHQEWISLAEKITVAIADIHRNRIIHKDICLSNIVINEKGQIHLIDFGIASRLEHERQSVNNRDILKGALPYISPEQTGRMNRDLDYRSDYYSLGVILYKLITGRLPFHADDVMGWLHAHMALPPKSPSTVDPSVPESISQIILKLLAKTPEDRYQSSVGILHDLELCRQDLVGNLNGPFIPGSGDLNERFMVPQTVVGREKEIRVLEDGFQKMLKGSSQLLLIGGYSGVGKSALVHEVQKSIVKHNGFFISGKYEQYQRNVPFLALTEAFSDLVRILLSKSEDVLIRWGNDIKSVLCESAQVIVDIIPSLELVIGKQSPAPEVDYQKAVNRQIYLFKQFLSVIATEEHPLTIFIDDLQWGDYTTLRLLQAVMTDENIKQCYIIGTYRNNEVDESHYLHSFIRDIKKERTITELSLAPLTRDGVTTITASTLHRSPEYVAPLAEEIFSRTKGHPFFVRVMLISLFRNGKISLSQESRWEYELTDIEELGLADNVVDIMVKVVNELPKESREVLTTAAVIGNRFNLKTLSLVLTESETDIAEVLNPVLNENLIIPLESDYRTAHLSECKTGITYVFQHDKIQQAAYSLITEAERQQLHLTVGRALLLKESNNRILDIVSHFNKALELLKSSEHHSICDLNIKAAVKAKNAGDFGGALLFLSVAESLTNAMDWGEHSATLKLLYKTTGTCAYLQADTIKAQRCFEILLDNITDPFERAEILILQAPFILMVEKDVSKSVDLGLLALQLIDPEFPVSISEEEWISSSKALIQEANIQKNDTITELKNENVRLLMKILVGIVPPLYFQGKSYQMLFYLQKIMHFSYKYGFAPESAFGFAHFDFSLPEELAERERAFRMAEFAMSIVAHFKDLQFSGAVYYLNSAYTYYWYLPREELTDYYKKAYEQCSISGDVLYSNVSLSRRLYDSPYSTLEEAVAECITWLPRITSPISKLGAIGTLTFFLNLSGKTENRASYRSEFYDEETPYYTEFEKMGLSVYLFGDRVLRIHRSFLYEEYSPLVDLFEDGEIFQYGQHKLVQGYFFTFMHLTQFSATITAEIQNRLDQKMSRMNLWCRKSGVNFFQFQLMMKAELHRLAGEDYDAICCYEKAVTFCKKRNYREYLALALKLLGKYYLELDKEDLARFYLSESYYAYELWGANRVCEFLEEKYGKFLSNKEQHKRTGTSVESSTTVNINSQLDLNAVLVASRTLSEERSLSALLTKFMTLMQEGTGAQRIVLLLPSDVDWFIEAERQEDGDVSVLPHKNINSNTLPMEIFHLCEREGEEIIIDSCDEKENENDLYISRFHPKTLAMVPIKNREQQIGLLYLENSLTSGVFTGERMEMVRILASQVAVSIENAQVYGKLEEKVKKRTLELTEANVDLKEARLEADRANQAKSDFLANMSHEIRTPMNAILGFSEILLEQEENSGKKHYLNSIYTSGNALLTLIIDILDLSKVEAGMMRLEYAPFSLSSLMEEIRIIFSQKVDAKGLDFAIVFDPEIPAAIILDVTRLRQILLNLLGNAIKFTAEGTVSLQAQLNSREDGRCSITLSVVDSGIGIEESQTDKIFEASSYLLFIFIYLLILLNNYLFSYLFLLFYIYLNNIILIKCNFLYVH